LKTIRRAPAATLLRTNRPQLPALSKARQLPRGGARTPTEWFNSPVPPSAIPTGRLLIVGLAPGLQGANRTGGLLRRFRGDLLYATLLEYGLPRARISARPDDGLTLIDCLDQQRGCAAVPPQNKPLPAEISTCRQFLSVEQSWIAELRANRGARAAWRMNRC